MSLQDITKDGAGTLATRCERGNNGIEALSATG